MRAHKVPTKSADAILDEFQFGLAFGKKGDSPLQRSPPAHQLDCNHLETSTKTKLCSPKSQRRNQNLLYSISGGLARDDNLENSLRNGTESNLSSSTMQIKQIQRRLISFFFFILLLSLFIILTLHLIVAAYTYHQQGAFRRSQQLVIESLPSSQQQQQQSGAFTPASSPLNGDPPLEQDSLSSAPTGASKIQALESKLLWFERQLERLAIDHEETKNRLREREKCACSIGCSFNGTRFSDGQRWQRKCDVCTCQSGRISCVARECPRLDCEDQVQLPGQCCPSCMKKCKINNKLVRHGHAFQPSRTSGEPLGKRCTCQDGLIKCEQLEVMLEGKQAMRMQPLPAETSKNRTLEYLKSILGNPQVQLLTRRASAH